MFKTFPLKCFSLIHTSGNCKVNGSQARHPTASTGDTDGLSDTHGIFLTLFLDHGTAVKENTSAKNTS
jgi:hypothetical protein